MMSVTTPGDILLYWNNECCGLQSVMVHVSVSSITTSTKNECTSVKETLKTYHTIPVFSPFIAHQRPWPLPALPCSCLVYNWGHSSCQQEPQSPHGC